MRFHKYVVFILDIKELMELSIVTVCHILREGNKCIDFMAKLEATSDNDLSLHLYPHEGLLNLLKALMVCLVQRNGGERFNGWEGKGCILVKYVLFKRRKRREEKDFN